MTKIITVPFGWLLSFLYDLTNNYGVALIIFAALVQLILDGQIERAKTLRDFLVSLGTNVSLTQMSVPLDRTALEMTLIEATTGPDMAHIPYEITPDMVFKAMVRVESLSSPID